MGGNAEAFGGFAVGEAVGCRWSAVCGAIRPRTTTLSASSTLRTRWTSSGAEVAETFLLAFRQRDSYEQLEARAGGPAADDQDRHRSHCVLPGALRTALTFY